MAKIRLGFVTNSSSSSFIIARKNDVTDEELINWFVENGKLEEFIVDSENLEWCYDLSESRLHEVGIEQYKKEVAKMIVDLLPSSDDKYDTNMNIGDYIVTATDYGSEDGDLGGIYFYCHNGFIDTDMLKVKGTC